MKLREKIDETVGALAPVYDAREARNIIDIAIEYLKGWSRVDILMNMDKEISDFFSERLDSIVNRLLRHEPIQYITGDTYWHGLTLKVGPGVLIPRPETSQLVDIIADENTRPDLRVVDLGTGSGAIAVALARQLNFPTVWAVDISDDALKFARANNEALKTDVKIVKSDILAGLPFDNDEFDIIVSNPPYICDSEKKAMDRNVLDYEPPRALFVPDDNPLEFYKAIAVEGYRISSPGGHIYLEINPLHAEGVRDLLSEAGWEDALLLNDMYGKRRFAKAIKR